MESHEMGQELNKTKLDFSIQQTNLYIIVNITVRVVIESIFLTIKT